MLLITVSTQIIRRGLALPRKRILLSYLLAMITIFGGSGIFFYLFVIKSLNQQLDRELLTLVEAAAPSLNKIKNGGEHSLEQDMTWQNLFTKRHYSLEWYDPSGKLLAREGKNLVRSPLFKYISPAELNKKQPILHRQGKIQTATISVYTNNPEKSELVLEGYIRASESTQRIEAILQQLRLALELGGATAIILVTVSSVYLTQVTLKPMKQGVQRIRQITANVSHQVRTPLTRINIATEILLAQTSKTQSNQIKKLNIINAATEQIKRLLEELLFLIRSDLISNIKELHFSYVPLTGIMSSLQAQFEPIVRSQGITLHTRLPPSNVLLQGDREQLMRLFSILLENAITYTDSGGSISFSARQLPNKIVVTVEDTGMGIPQEDLGTIFQDFWRSESAKIRHPSGFGLGLAIAAVIVRQHRGKIKVKSETGIGSSFQIHLPVKSLSR